MLNAYDGQAITYDTIGNPLTDGTWTYTWQHGRQLASMTDGTNTWNYTYNADGLRTKRQDSMSQYQYFYNGDRLSEMQVMTFAIDEGFFNMSFAYDASGVPLTVTYNDTVYYYVTNIQGDVVGILDGSGTQVVSYTYDAWGNVLNVSGSMASVLGTYNPLRYRGYVYDQETKLYYLQSRYYNPETGRFINADAFASTGQGLLGNNMFAYCLNNPGTLIDPIGLCANTFSIYFKVDCGQKNCPTSCQYQPSLALISSNGIYGSVNVGAFVITGAITMAVDTKSNVQIQGSFGFDVSTSGSFSASAGMVNNWGIAPDISSFLGDTYSIGSGHTAAVPEIPVLLTMSNNVFMTGDGYWGISHTSGVAKGLNLDIPSKDLLGGEYHGGYSYTVGLSPTINIFEWLRSTVS